MKKKLAVGILSVALLVGGATAALGATDSQTINDLKALYQQMFQLKSDALQQEVAAGTITQAQADLYQQSMEAKEVYRQQSLDSGVVFGTGMGKGMRGGSMGLNTQTLTQEQIDAYNAYMQQRQQIYNEAVANGTIIPGTGTGIGTGLGGGYGGGKGARGGYWGTNGVVPTVPAVPAAPTN